jgi:heptosyltransferase-3
VLLVTPLVRSLARAWPAAQVDVLVFRGTEAALEGNPDVARVVVVGERDSIGERLATLARLWRRYDLALSAQTSDRTTLYAWAAGRRVAGLLDPARAPAWKRGLLDAWLPFDNLEVHTVVAGLSLCDVLSIERCHEVVPPGAPGYASEAAAALGLDIPAERFAVLHVSPKFVYKSWPASGWRALACWLSGRGIRPVIAAGSAAEEQALAAEVMAGLGPAAVDASGRLTLPALAALLGAAAVYVGTDTAVTHIAAATGVPTVALFGPSNPVKWGPWPRGCTTAPSPWARRGTQQSGNVTLVQGEGSCVPCLFEGCDRHVNSLSRCLQELPAGVVIAAVEEALGRVSGPGAVSSAG